MEKITIFLSEKRKQLFFSTNHSQRVVDMKTEIPKDFIPISYNVEGDIIEFISEKHPNKEIIPNPNPNFEPYWLVRM